MAEVDLHLHTTISDGRLTPKELIELLVERGICVAAITDHDITDGLEEAWETAQAYPHLTIIPGVELSTDIPGNEIHILGYYIDYLSTDLQSALADFRSSRVDRAKSMVKQLANLGMPVEWTHVLRLAGEGAIGRPHIARALMEMGYVTTLKEAFDLYLSRNGPAYVERGKQTPSDAVKLIVEANGVPVLAHPGQIIDLDDILVDLKKAGLEGMEVHYAEYDMALIQKLEATAKRHDLLPCGGTDYHANGSDGEPIPGDLGPPLAVAERLAYLASLKTPYTPYGTKR
jgi:hypothetical protein